MIEVLGPERRLKNSNTCAYLDHVDYENAGSPIVEVKKPTANVVFSSQEYSAPHKPERLAAEGGSIALSLQYETRG